MTIQLNHITKEYSHDIVLDDITMKITDGEHIAVVGENGSGKSTLLKIIAGIEPMQSGELIVSKGTTIAYLHQMFEAYEGTVQGFLLDSYTEINHLQKQLTELEIRLEQADETELETLLKKYGRIQERFEQADGYQIMTFVDQVAQGLHMEHLLQRSYADLSGGEKTRVNLAKQLLKKPDVLLLDEPTNHLDFNGIRWLENYIRNRKETVVIVSHDRTFLNQCVTKIYELAWGEIQAYQGNYDAYKIEKEKRFLQLQQNYEEQQKQMKKMEGMIRRFRQWGQIGDNEKFFKKAKMLEKRLENMERLKLPKKQERNLHLQIRGNKEAPKKLLEVRGVTKAYGSNILFHQLNLSVFWKERIAVCGDNGAGKSTLLKMIMRTETIDEGEVLYGNQLQIGYLPQIIEFPKEDERILTLAQYELELNEEDTRRYLIRFGFTHADMAKRLRSLSGGERTRLKLSFILKDEIQLLIFDEPTNHLDFSSIEIIEEVLQEFKGSLLLVSHDRYFIQSLCDKVWMIENGSITEYLNDKWMKQVL